MSRLHKMPTLFLIAALFPLLALSAQQPPPDTKKDQPAAKEKQKEAARPAETKKAAKPSTDPIDRIKEEGLKRSKVMETLSYLTDVIGPRLTGSPGLNRANIWTADTLASWGLENAHCEAWGKFGRGWSLKRFSAQVVAPQCIPLIAYPKAWSPGTGGPLVAPVVLLDAKTEADLAKYKGKLKGAIVLPAPQRNLVARFEPMAGRLTDSELLELANASEPVRRRSSQPAPATAPTNGEPQTAPTVAAAATSGGSSTGSAPAATTVTGAGEPSTATAGSRQTSQARQSFTRRRLRFLMDEGAALLADPSTGGDGGTLFVYSASLPAAESSAAGGSSTAPGGTRTSVWDKDAPATLPQMVIASEHYNRLVRMLELGESLKMEVDLAVEFHDDDVMAYNTVAEIPGTDLKDELVMLGAHMDSWHSGTGATDNAAGVAVTMEAVRILKALNLKPRRTIRIGLWTGEEQGLLGSRGYVSEHFQKVRARTTGGRPTPAEPTAAKSKSESKSESESQAEFAPKPAHAKFSAYFNLDNGTGKIRGVYLQGNDSVRPIFRKWLEPFREMGATTLTIVNTGGTDHQSFDGVGLPGFQFIQDHIEYETRTHHSNQDVYDRIQAEDMKQAAVIMAAFVYNAATLEEKLPRKPAAR